MKIRQFLTDSKRNLPKKVSLDRRVEKRRWKGVNKNLFCVGSSQRVGNNDDKRNSAHLIPQGNKGWRYFERRSSNRGYGMRLEGLGKSLKMQRSRKLDVVARKNRMGQGWWVATAAAARHMASELS